MAIALLELTLPTPAENLACDEALLDECEAGAFPGGVLRLWQSTRPFVVLGYANRVEQEVKVGVCRARGVPILRRCTGGGTVLQGTGCLNYAVIVPLAADPALASITGTNRFVMERNREAVAKLLGRRVSIEGHTDLAMDGRKFSGNSQRRRREWLLFHGTVLIEGFDLDRVEELLRAPPRQPAYREQRTHAEFLTCLPLAAENVARALARAWQATSPAAAPPHERMEHLVAERYGRDDWNFKW